MLQRFLLPVLIIPLMVFSIVCSGQIVLPSRFDSAYTELFRINSGGWTAGDATISIPLPDKRVIWLFGDSYTVAVNTSNNTLPCLFQVRNCFMVQDSIDQSHFKTILDTTKTGVNMTTFKLRPNDTSIFWPGHGYVYQDTVYIFLERYKSTNLNYEGCYVAKLTYPALHQVAIVPAPATAPNTIFGRAAVVDSASGKLYIYGNKLNWIVWEPVVARCDIANPLINWEFYTGSGWSSSPQQVQKIGNDPVSPGFSVFPKGGKYYLITQENGYLECDYGREIWSYSSNYPWGPFDGKTLLYIEESKFNGEYLLTYNGQAHPWNIENGELLISYNVNDRVDTVAPHVCPSQCQNIWTDRLDADTYRPKFIRVPMVIIVSTGDHPDELFNKSVQLRVLHHPVSSHTTFQAEMFTQSSWNGTIKLLDLSGKAIWSKEVSCGRGRNNLTLQAPSRAGVYFLELTGADHYRKVAKLAVY